VALGDLRSLVLSDHTLHLGQQPRLGVIGDLGRVGEVHLAAEPVELVEHQHLVGVGAREPVGRQAPHRLDHACLGGVAQRVQAGAVKPRAGVAAIEVLATISWPSAAIRARNSSTCEPIVPRFSWPSLDTRA
jgi:hypothetical protein